MTYKNLKPGDLLIWIDIINSKLVVGCFGKMTPLGLVQVLYEDYAETSINKDRVILPDELPDALTNTYWIHYSPGWPHVISSEENDTLFVNRVPLFTIRWDYGEQSRILEERLAFTSRTECWTF